jgi:hypothetical protein
VYNEFAIIPRLTRHSIHSYPTRRKKDAVSMHSLDDTHRCSALASSLQGKQLLYPASSLSNTPRHNSLPLALSTWLSRFPNPIIRRQPCPPFPTPLPLLNATPTKKATRQHNPAVLQTGKRAKKTKTYNSGYSPVVTHLTTNPPVHCLSTAERTGSSIFSVLWSYVKDLTLVKD